LAGVTAIFKPGVCSPRIYLAQAQVAELASAPQPDEKSILVRYQAMDGAIVLAELKDQSVPRQLEPGDRVWVLYDVRTPAQARWAGRGWKHEPARRLAQARRHDQLTGWSWLLASAAACFGFAL
jgi:hypothetical protein